MFTISLDLNQNVDVIKNEACNIRTSRNIVLLHFMICRGKKCQRPRILKLYRNSEVEQSLAKTQCSVLHALATICI